MVSPHKVVGDVAEAGLSRMVGTIAVILPAVALLQVLANAHDYRQPAAVIAVWLAVLGAAAWLTPRMRARVLSGAEAAAAIALAIAAVTVVGAERQGQVMPGSVDLAILGTMWLLVVVVMSVPIWVSVPAALTVYAVHSALLIRAEAVNPLTLSELEAAAYICAAFLIAAAVLRPTMAVHVTLGARRASLASRSAAERAAAAAISHERQSRLAVLEREALPLLRGIADGTLDPTASDVRDRCARHAAVLRHSLTEGASGAGDLAGGLEPTFQAARERGLLVTVQLVGDPGPAPPRLAAAVLATVDAVLGALPPQQVTLTVLTVGDDVELYLAFDVPSPSGPDLTQLPQPNDLPVEARWRATVNAADSGGGYLEVSWRKDGIA
jgi:hypothetical protein